MNLKLHLTLPDTPTKVIDLTDATLPTVIGRDSEVSQVVIPDTQSSRAHCSLDIEDDKVMVEDMGSRNGSWLNGDVMAGYVALLERGKSGEVYNLCAGEGVSIAEVIALLRAHARVPMRVWSDPKLRRPSEVERIVGSHEKATLDTGWAPRIPLTDTLRDLLEDWRARRD